MSRLVSLLIALTATACATRNSAVRLRNLSNDAWAAIGAPADTFTSSTGPVDPDARIIADAFLAGLPPAYRALMVHAPALDRVATADAITEGESGNVLAASVVRDLLWRVGEPGTYFRATASWVQGSDRDERLATKAGEFAKKLTLFKVPYAFGVAHVHASLRMHVMSIVLVERAVTLGPFPTRRLADQEIALSGRFEVAVKKPRVHVRVDDYRVRTLPIKVAEDGRFAVKLPGLRGAGRHFIEITSRRARADPARVSEWSNTILLVPIEVGPADGRSVDPPTSAIPPDPTDTQAMVAQMLLGYDAVRVQIGRPGLILDPALSALAAVRIAEVRAAPEVGSPPDFSARIRAAGVEHDGWRERTNAEGMSVPFIEILRGELDSPSQRAIFASARYVRVGIHVERTPEGRIAFHVIFTRAPAPPAKG